MNKPWRLSGNKSVDLHFDNEPTSGQHYGGMVTREHHAAEIFFRRIELHPLKRSPGA